MTKPLDKHDVRQGAYRGEDNQPHATGIPDGKERHDPSASDASLPEDKAQEDDNNPDGRTQPNMGQAGTYGAGNEETEVTSRNRVHGPDAPSRK
jgi:hypothetical protein